MTAIQRSLVTGIAVYRGHHTAFDAKRFVQNLGKRGQTIGCARSVRHHFIGCDQFVIVYAENHCPVDVFAGC